MALIAASVGGLFHFRPHVGSWALSDRCCAATDCPVSGAERERDLVRLDRCKRRCKKRRERQSCGMTGVSGFFILLFVSRARIFLYTLGPAAYYENEG